MYKAQPRTGVCGSRESPTAAAPVGHGLTTRAGTSPRQVLGRPCLLPMPSFSVGQAVTLGCGLSKPFPMAVFPR